MEKQNNKQNINRERSQIRWGLTGIIVLFLAALGLAIPTQINTYVIKNINSSAPINFPTLPEQPFKLGLDLQGGVHLTYRADLSDIPQEDKKQAIQGSKEVIQRRVSGIGVNDATVRTSQTGDSWRINVELPGVEDKQNAIDKIGKTPILKFKEATTSTPERKLTEKEQQQLNEFNQQAESRSKDILQEVKNNPDKFEEIARNKSEDKSTSDKGGYLGYVTSSTVPNLYSWAQDQQEGDISQELVKNSEGYNILKRGKVEPGPKQVKLRHILICHTGSEDCEDPIYTKSEAEAKANQLFNRVNSYNFYSIARKNSDDEATKDKGGELEFMLREEVKNKFNEQVATATFKQNVGEIFGPIHTYSGYHIFYKTNEKTLDKYELWRILVKTKNKEDFLPEQTPWENTKLSGANLEGSEVVTDQRTGQVQVSLQFDEEGTELFRQITERNIGKPVGIFLDSEPISTPVVNQAIPNGQAVIRGNFSMEEAQQLATRLNAGALPVPIDIISQQGVGASLGQESLAKSLKAGIAAVIVVMLFMVAFYRLPGLLSVIALSAYIAFNLAVYKLIGVTLTLAGIAGFILSIGMAVDANVLIFERLKEELRGGRSLKSAVEEGFKRAWPSIRDGNVSTLITCFMLLMFGTSFVVGFAITLAIGVLLSMFSAITITRLLLKFVAPWFSSEGNLLFLGSNQDKN